MILKAILTFAFLCLASGEHSLYERLNIEDVCHTSHMATQVINTGLIIYVNRSLTFDACILDLYSVNGDGLILSVEYFECDINSTRDDMTRVPAMTLEASYKTQEGTVKSAVFDEEEQRVNRVAQCGENAYQTLYYQLHYSIEPSMKVLVQRNSKIMKNEFAYAMVFTPTYKKPNDNNSFACVRGYTTHWINVNFVCDEHVNCATVPKPLDENSCPNFLYYEGYDVTAHIMKKYYWNFWFNLSMIIGSVFLVICILLSLKLMCGWCKKDQPTTCQRRSPTNQDLEQLQVNVPEKSSSVTYPGITNKSFQNPPTYDSLFVNQTPEEATQLKQTS